MTAEFDSPAAVDPELDAEADEEEGPAEDLRVAGGLCRLEAPTTPSPDEGGR